MSEESEWSFRYICETLILYYMETTIFEDAVKAYAKFCEEQGYIFSQPHEAYSVVGRKYVYLENSNGKLAKYEMATKRIIK